MGYIAKIILIVSLSFVFKSSCAQNLNSLTFDQIDSVMMIKVQEVKYEEGILMTKKVSPPVLFKTHRPAEL